jgi:hypothetical protein
VTTETSCRSVFLSVVWCNNKKASRGNQNELPLKLLQPKRVAAFFFFLPSGATKKRLCYQ